jgi:hypothetical protein
VIVLSNGQPDRSLRLRAALTHAGSEAMITGLQAARLHGVRHLPHDETVHVLVPHRRRVASWGFARIERTVHLPEPTQVAGVPVVPLARALIDAARRMSDLNAVRTMIAEAVQRGLCDPTELRSELATASTIGSAIPRRVVAEMNAGVRSAAEAWGHRLVKRSRLPEPEWNVEIRTSTGKLLGIADAWWGDVALALEIDSLEFHLGPTDYARTVDKHTRMTAAGIPVVHVLPSRLRDDPRGVIRELEAAYHHAARRPPPKLRTRLARRTA